MRASVTIYTSVLFHLLLIQCYISSLVFDLWFLTYDLHTVLCIFACSFIMYLHGFFFSIAESTYPYWISSWFCGNILPRLRSFILPPPPTSSICNATQCILRRKLDEPIYYNKIPQPTIECESPVHSKSSVITLLFTYLKNIMPKLCYLNLIVMFNLCWYKREWRNQPREGTSALPSSTVAWPPVKEGSQGALPEWGSRASQHFSGVGWQHPWHCTLWGSVWISPYILKFRLSTSF